MRVPPLGGIERRVQRVQPPAGRETVSADEHIAVLEQRELVLCALDTIEIDRRAVLVMRDVDDMPVPQIAKMLDIPLNTAHTRLRLAREQLAAAVTRLRISRGAR